MDFDSFQKVTSQQSMTHWLIETYIGPFFLKGASMYQNQDAAFAGVKNHLRWKIKAYDGGQRKVDRWILKHQSLLGPAEVGQACSAQKTLQRFFLGGGGLWIVSWFEKIIEIFECN